ncbi:MAG: zinc ribbon domain-containing protein [Acidobacteriota bacterium]|nr:zinc ribbon domain-containing protein [Acidobacteriota bacterium]
MFCDRCGTNLSDGQSFCPSCGKPVRSVQQLPVQGRIEKHVKLLGILWLAISAVRLLPGLALMAASRTIVGFLPPDVPMFVPGLIQLGGLLLLGAGVLGVAVGWGLLTFQPWARMLAIVFGCLSLFEVPFGTALGVYTLWVLLPEKSEQEYHAKATEALGAAQM